MTPLSFTIPGFPTGPAYPVPPPVTICPPQLDPFAQLANREMENVLATANHRFFGLNMSQHPQAVVKLNQLLNALQPARIIEIGAGNGGLTVLFALHCIHARCQLHAYDKTEGKHAGLLERLGYPVVLKDVLEDPGNVEEVKALVAAPGRTLLVADAGKALEHNLYVPSFKVGDVVMMHDFAPDLATFERDIKCKVWNWCESWYDRVAETCARHGIEHSSYTGDVVWSLGWRAH